MGLNASKEERELCSYCEVPSKQLTGEAATTLRIRAYNATGELDNRNNVPEQRVEFTLGTRFLLTCNVTKVPEGYEVVSYRWFHKRTGNMQRTYEIPGTHPYFRVVYNTLLVDVTSWDQGGRYYCFVKFRNMQIQADESTRTSTVMITVAG